MKIAVLGHKQIGYRSGGIEKTVCEIAVRLSRMGHEVTVFDRKLPGEDTVRTTAGLSLDSENIDVCKISTVRGAAEVPFYSLKAASAVARGDFDIVLFNASGPSLMIPIVKRSGKKTVSFIHGLDSRSVKWGRFASWYLRQGEKTAAKYADRVLVLSDHIRSHFENEYGIRPELVFNGIDMPEKPADEEVRRVLCKYSLEKDGYMLWTGRISAEKGLLYLLDAFHGCDTDMKLVLAGDMGSQGAGYAAAVKTRSESDKRVLLPGMLPADELTVLYSNCYAFVFPSESEGMPHSLLEALSCGAQCIVSDIPENRVLAGEHALYFRPGEVTGLSTALQKAIAEPGERSGRTAGEAEEITRRYAWDASAELIEKICKDVLDS